MPLEDYAQTVIDFIRMQRVWAVPIVFALAFRESLAFFFLLDSWLGDLGRDRRIGCRRRPLVLAGLDRRRSWSGARGLGLLLDWL